MSTKARQLFIDGVTAYRQQRWEDAHAAFLAASALVQHYSIEGNLADCEIRLGQYQAAAKHLARYVREIVKDSESTAAERAAGAAHYAQVREKIGVANVHASQPGAEIFVDGELAGTEPLEDPVFLVPGEHFFEARSEGYPTARTTVTAEAGVAKTVTLTLEQKTVEPPSPSRPPSPPTPQGAEPPPRVGLGWIVATGVLAATGLGTGIALTVAANGKDSEASTLGAKLGSATTCTGNPVGSVGANCTAVMAALQDKSTLLDGAVVSFIGSGVFALAAGGLGFWSASTPKTSDEHKAAVQVVPVVGAQDVGLVFIGTW
jgi:hypothetical protein